MLAYGRQQNTETESMKYTQDQLVILEILNQDKNFRQTVYLPNRNLKSGSILYILFYSEITAIGEVSFFTKKCQIFAGFALFSFQSLPFYSLHFYSLSV